MNILFIGDISGKPGRFMVREYLPKIKEKYQIDLTIADCENAATGLGVTSKVLNELSGYGIDYFTAGDHIWHFSDFVEDLQNKSLPIVRPYNYEGGKQIPGKAYDILDIGSKGKIVIACFLGQVFLPKDQRNPFWAADDFLAELQNEGIEFGKDIILLDIHAEATAEKINLATYLKNKATAVVGTHTHVATADTRLLGTTAFVTDVGMTGPYDASLWIKLEQTIHNFKYPFKVRGEMEEGGSRVFNSVLIETDEGRAKSITRIDYIHPEL